MKSAQFTCCIISGFFFRDAAKAIILHLQSEENSDKWEATMKVCDSETKTHTPMRLLIQAMPGDYSIKHFKNSPALY